MASVTPATSRTALPAREQRLQIVAGAPVLRKDVDVRPVLGELLLELRDGRLERRDLVLDPVELGRALRALASASSRRTCGFGFSTFGGASSAARSSRMRTYSAQPPSYELIAPVLDRERALGDRVEERAVVRHEQDGAGKRLERRLERLAALEVEVVRRLVEHQEVRARRDDDREREPAPLASREHLDRLLVLGPAREEELPEQLLRLRSLEPGHRLHALEHRAAVVELDLLLREVRGLHAVPEPRSPGTGLAVAEDRLEQRRLARAVRADERDMLAALECERRVVEQVLVARGEERGPPPRRRCGRCAAA